MKRMILFLCTVLLAACTLAVCVHADDTGIKPWYYTANSELYRIGNCTYGVTPRTKVSALRSEFSIDIVVKNASQQVLADTKYVGTGAKLYSADGTLLSTLITDGDVNGNGTLDSNDITLLRSIYLGTSAGSSYGKTTAGYTAADTNGNGKIDSNDYIRVFMAILGIKPNASRQRPADILDQAGETEKYISTKAPDITTYSAAVQSAYNGYAARAENLINRYLVSLPKEDEAWILAGQSLARLYSNTEVAAANSDLRLLCSKYPPRDSAVDPFESYFQMNLMLRCYYQFGDLLEASTKTAIQNYFLTYLNAASSLSDAADRPTVVAYNMHDSENHHIVQRSAFYLGAQLLVEAGRGSVTLSKGGTVQEHYTAWGESIVAYLANRGRYGVNLESGSYSYYKYVMDSLLSLYDFANDASVRSISQKTLDVYMAESVLQTSLYCRGDAVTRCYRKGSATAKGAPEFYMMGFFGTNYSKFQNRTINSSFLSMFMTDYRPASYLYDLSVNNIAKTPYTFEQYMTSSGSEYWDGNQHWYFTFHPLAEQAYKSTYVTSEFVMGTFTSNQKADAYYKLLGFRQNQIMRVVFSAPFPTAHTDVRLYFIGSTGNQNGYGEFDGINKNGAMIVSRAKLASGDTRGLVMYASNELDFTEANGWLVAKEPSTGAYVGVYGVAGVPVVTASDSIDGSKSGLGKLYVFDTAGTTAVVQCAMSAEFSSLDAFAAALARQPLTYDAATKTVSYTNFAGDELVYCANGSVDPTINGTPVNFIPMYVYQSPYMNEAYGSGIVTITDTKGNTYAINFCE